MIAALKEQEENEKQKAGDEEKERLGTEASGAGLATEISTASSPAMLHMCFADLPFTEL